MTIDWNKIQKAIDVIKSGICNRCDIDNVIVYKCGTIIRIVSIFIIAAIFGSAFLALWVSIGKRKR